MTFLSRSGNFESKEVRGKRANRWWCSKLIYNTVEQDETKTKQETRTEGFILYLEKSRH